MKINRLETHDRLLHFKKDQALNINQGADDCLKRNPLSLGLQQYSPYIYIFAHPRTADDGVSKRMLWQPRLTKPKAQTNSYLFRAQSHSDVIEVCWLLPPPELWNQYMQSNLFEDELILWSVGQYQYNRKKLQEPYVDDLDDEQVKAIYKRVYDELKYDDMKEKYQKIDIPFDLEKKI